jgi:transposase InsO family protein
VKYAVIQANVVSFSVQTMCNTLDVSRAGFYAWRSRKDSPRATEDHELLAVIQDIHEQSRGTYGSPRVAAALKKRGHKCGRKRVARLMRRNGVVGKKRRQYRVSTTDSKHEYAVSPNLLNRSFSPNAYVLNQAWAGDITGVPTTEGVLYLAIVLDLCSREIVGWSMLANRDTSIVIDALRMALDLRRPNRGLVFHSDQGSQYASGPFRAFLEVNGVLQSMSRRGNCWDNAPVESFFATMKLEIDSLARSRTRASAQAAIFEYLAVFYNRQRLHSAVGNEVPASVGRASLAA